jgi:ABC-type multidrug transport system ATPase subunit
MRSSPAHRGPAIEVTDLAKVYPGPNVALKDVSFAVKQGEMFGFLGPNGSGKTTTVRILVTLLQMTAGVARVGGYDVAREQDRVREVIGWAGQSIGIDDDLTGAENVALQAMLHGLSHGDAWSRAAEVLDELSLTEVADERAGRLSGGLRRRLDLATALVHRPAVLFLDEPTTGLDPQSRAALWEHLRGLSRNEGTTIFLTTQHLEEADLACDRVAIIDGGHLVTVGTPAALKEDVGEGRLKMVIPDADRARAARVLEACSWVIRVQLGDPLVVYVRDATASLPPLLQRLSEEGIDVAAIEQSQATLNDVFLRYTGRLPRTEAPVSGATSGIFAAAHGRRRR